MIVSTTATTTTVGGPGRQGSGTAQRVLSRGWAHFGAVPLLVGHVASLPYAVSKDANPEPQTAWFVIAALAAAALDAAARAAWLPGAASIPLKKSGALLCAANCLLASTCLFMVFCQGYPSTSERSSSLGASDFYQNVVSYAEHAYMLVLMAVCRIVAAVTRNEEKGIMRQDNKSRQGWLEPGLNGACIAMFVVSCVALLATGGDENLVMNTWVVGAEQWWMHWLLFGILLASYYLWDDTAEEGGDDDDGHGSDDDDALLKRWIDPACRLLAVVVACVAFHVHMMPSSSEKVRQARFNAIDYFSLRRLGSLRDFFTVADVETWWIVLLRGFTVQLWIALVAGRWFAECMQQICEVRAPYAHAPRKNFIHGL